MSCFMPHVILSADVWGSCNRGSKVDLANRMAQLICKRAENRQESQGKVFVFTCFVSPETKQVNKEKHWNCYFRFMSREREREKNTNISLLPLTLSPSSLLPPPQPLSVHQGKAEKKALRQQYALPPAPRRGRQKPRNQRRAHVKSHCEAPSGSLPALACFPRWSHSDPPPPPPPLPTNAGLSVGRKCSYTLSHELTHVKPNWTICCSCCCFGETCVVLFSSASGGAGRCSVCSTVSPVQLLSD